MGVVTLRPPLRRRVRVLTFPELFDLPVVVNVPTAGRALGMGVNKAYRLAREGRFPCCVIKHGHRYQVPTRALMRALEIDSLPVSLDDVDRGAGFAARLD